MDVVWFRFRSEVRARWRALVGAVVLVGIAGGIVLGSVAAARRTSSAFPRFVEFSNPYHFLLSPEGTSLTGFSDAIAALPEVEDVALVAGFNVELTDPAVPEEASAIDAAFAAIDDKTFRKLMRLNIIEGRATDRTASDEITINPVMAETYGLGAGDEIGVNLFSFGEFGPTHPVAVRLRIVGISVAPPEVIPPTHFDSLPGLMMTSAGYERWKDVGLAFDGMLLRVASGTDAAAFLDRARGIARSFPDTGSELFFSDERDRNSLVSRALRPQVIALWAFAAVAGLTVMLVLAQVTGRQVLIDSVEHPTLRAMGVRPVQLVAVTALRSVSVGILGAIIAVVLGWLSSLLTPIGPARLAEIDPGLAFDAVALGAGACGLIVVVVASAVARALRIAGAPSVSEPPRRPSAIATQAARLGASAPAATGIRLALEPGTGRAAIPVRSTLAGALTALVAVVATFTFGASLDRLVSTPSSYGQDWDLVFDVGFGVIGPHVMEILGSDEGVAAITGGGYALIDIDGKQVPAVGLRKIRGDVYPTLLGGRAADGADELVVGTSTLKQLGKAIGDDVSVRTADGERRMRIVGEAVFPQLGQGGFTPTGLGRGAAIPHDLVPVGFAGPGFQFALMRVAPGADPGTVVDRLRARCEATSRETEDLCHLVQRQTPPDIANYARIRSTPVVLAGVLGILAAATITHALVTSVVRRRRDLAVLRTLGFVRGQIARAVAWQATTLAGLAVFVGLPAGVILGRWAWAAFADELGVSAGVAVPVAVVAAVGGGALVLANLVAALPARAAAGTEPALVLRVDR